MVAFWIFLAIFLLGMLWASAPLWQGRDACPYGCRTIYHDGGPYGIPTSFEYDNPQCPDHGKA